MPKESFSRTELINLYNDFKGSIEADQQELKKRLMHEKENTDYSNDPDLNRFAGKIAGQTEFALELAHFIEYTPAPKTIADIDKT